MNDTNVGRVARQSGRQYMIDNEDVVWILGD